MILVGIFNCKESIYAYFPTLPDPSLSLQAVRRRMLASFTTKPQPAVKPALPKHPFPNGRQAGENRGNRCRLAPTAKQPHDYKRKFHSLAEPLRFSLREPSEAAVPLPPREYRRPWRGVCVRKYSACRPFPLPLSPRGESVISPQPLGTRRGSKATSSPSSYSLGRLPPPPAPEGPRRASPHSRPAPSAFAIPRARSPYPDPRPSPPAAGHSRVEAQLALVPGALAPSVLAAGRGAVPRHGGAERTRGGTIRAAGVRRGAAVTGTTASSASLCLLLPPPLASGLKSPTQRRRL